MAEILTLESGIMFMVEDIWKFFEYMVFSKGLFIIVGNY